MSNYNREWIPGWEDEGRAFVGAEVVSGTGEVVIDLGSQAEGPVTVHHTKARALLHVLQEKIAEAAEAERFSRLPFTSSDDVRTVDRKRHPAPAGPAAALE